MSVTGGKKVCISVLSSDQIGLCGIEHDWVSTAVSVEENSKEELSYRRKNAGGEKCVLLGESADGACVSCMNYVSCQSCVVCTTFVGNSVLSFTTSELNY